jgi:hypothetical protein
VEAADQGLAERRQASLSPPTVAPIQADPYARPVQGPDRPEALDPTRGLVRLLRGAGVGAGAVGVSLAGHLAGQGTVPSETTLIVMLAAATLVAWAVSFARWTLTSLTGVLIAAQSVLHLSFSAGSGADAGHHAGTMLLGHTAATVVMVALLRRGEDLLWAVAEGLGLRVWRTLRGFVPSSGVTAPAPVVDVRAPQPRCWHGGEPPRRGPPIRSRYLAVPA